MNKAPQSYWDKQNERVEFKPLRGDDPIRKMINRHIPANMDGIAFEAGCYPGRFLTVFGDLGYKLSGLDATPRVMEIASMLRENNYAVGRIAMEDFFDLPDYERFDVVSSFGFVEHFQNYLEVIQKHCRHVKQGGYLVMTAPNLRYGIPFLFHRWLNTKSFRQHVLQSIDPMGWSETISAEGFEVLFAGYCGGLDLWQSGEQTKWQQLISKLIIGFLQLLKRLALGQKLASINNKFLSSDIMVIGKKKTR